MKTYTESKLCNKCGRAHIIRHFDDKRNFIYDEIVPTKVNKNQFSKRTRICKG